VKLGIRIPYTGSVEGRDVIQVAQAAEERGFDTGFVGEHIVRPVAAEKAINPTASASLAAGKHPKPSNCPELAAWTTLTFAAAVTRKLRVASGVTVVALRHPLLFAKEIASLDVLSGGRVTCTLALGWMIEEFEALGIRYQSRRRRLEESIDVLRSAWTQPEVSYHGSQFDFGPVHSEPKPRQNPLPIWIGGNSQPAINRAIRMADGWYGSYLPSAQLKPMVDEIRTRRRDSPRAQFPFTIAVSRACVGQDDPPDYQPGSRLALADIPATMDEYRSIGVDMLIFDTVYQRPADLIRVMDAAAAAR
jgi:probable F420-dependent oxidoreductase